MTLRRCRKIWTLMILEHLQYHQLISFAVEGVVANRSVQGVDAIDHLSGKAAF